MSDLHGLVRRLATAEALLVMSDYDGTLAPIVMDPAAAVPDPEALAALHRLAAKPFTRVAIVSGRPRADLERLVGPPGALELIGSHGAEGPDGLHLSDAQRAVLEDIRARLAPMVVPVPGAMLEVKPAGVAVHTRRAEREAGDRLLASVVSAIGNLSGVRSLAGKAVVEYTVADVDKGTTVGALCRRLPGGVAVFIGDDVTDEDAFAALRPGDASIKVGEGPTQAGYRLPDQPAVGPFLAEIASAR